MSNNANETTCARWPPLPHCTVCGMPNAKILLAAGSYCGEQCLKYRIAQVDAKIKKKTNARVFNHINLIEQLTLSISAFTCLILDVEGAGYFVLLAWSISSILNSINQTKTENTRNL